VTELTQGDQSDREPSTDNEASSQITTDPNVQSLLNQIATARQSAPEKLNKGLYVQRVRALEIKNDQLEDDQKLKRKTLDRLFIFLATETIAIFMMAFFQGVKVAWWWPWPFEFRLDAWSFRLLVSATIVQVAAMLYVAVQHLFPVPKNNKHK
jgi:hypothetical protein